MSYARLLCYLWKYFDLLNLNTIQMKNDTEVAGYLMLFYIFIFKNWGRIRGVILGARYLIIPFKIQKTGPERNRF